jgi:hypothetical protein
MATKHPGAVALGKRRWEGLTAEERQAVARKGGKARLKTMTKRQRQDSARRAAEARWGKKEEKK